jgi:hypothetical protein
MATPRKPNAKRGRPPKGFSTDPDRHAVAIAMALQMIDDNTSEKAAFVVVSVHALGRKVAEHVMVAPRGKRGVGEIKAGTTVTTFERVSFIGQTATTFAGFASTLRRKKDRWMRQDPEAVIWLRAIATLIALFLRTAIEDGGDLQYLVRFLCDLAQRASQNSHAPDYSPRDWAREKTYQVQQQEVVPMLIDRDFYAGLSNPTFAAPNAMGARGPGDLTVIICEDEVASLIRMNPAALRSGSRGTLARELVELITNFMTERAA